MSHALLLTQDELLAAQFHKMCAVTQSSLIVSKEPSHDELARAYRVFLDQNLEVDPFAHPEVVILASDGVSSTTWSKAAEFRAVHVEVLPSTTDWLVEHLVPPSDSCAHIITVVPVLGGAGASTIACALAAAYAQSGTRVSLVDADCGAGGIDILMGCEQSEGLRWSDLDNMRGEISGPEFYDNLIAHQGIRVLAPARNQHKVTLETLNRAVDLLASACEVLIIDSPRLTARITQTLANASDHTLLVTPTTVQATAVLTSYKDLLDGSNAGLVIREIPGSGLTSIGIAQALQLPLLATVPTNSRIVEQVEQGLGVAQVSLGAFTRSLHHLRQSIESQQDNQLAS